MLISVIVPVYNVELYLPKCIESILRQTFENIELILIDDGSTDNSGLICDNYLAIDHRVRVLHKENGGVSSARNAGMDIAKGDYICFVDSDDWIEADYFSQAAYILEMHEPVILLNTYVKDDGLGKIENKFAYQEVHELSNEQALWEIMDNRITGWEPVASFYKATGCKNLRFAENICFGEDLLFKYCFIKEAKGKLYFQPFAKYHYYLRPGSACTSYNVAKKIDDLKVLEFIMQDSGIKLSRLLFGKEYLPRLVSYSILALENASKGDFYVSRILNKKINKNLSSALVCSEIPLKIKLKLLICAVPLYMLPAGILKGVNKFFAILKRRWRA